MFYMHNSTGWGWGWWMLMTIGMIAFWVLIIYAVVWLLRDRSSSQGQRRLPAQPPPEPPEQILKRRLAQGEVSLEEYERLQAAIHPLPPGPTTEQSSEALTGTRGSSA